MYKRSLFAFALAWIGLAHAASAHFIWITVQPSADPKRSPSLIEAFFNEPPVPEGTQFLKYVDGLKLTSSQVPVPAAIAEDALTAQWIGKLPVLVDAERDLGVMERGGKSHRLYYTARAQTEPVANDAAEKAGKLRVRLILVDDKPTVEVLFDGKPVPNARIMTYPDGKETVETTADESGRATIEGLAEGTTALWANWVDKTPGEVDGKPFEETRYYATLTYQPCTPEAGTATTTASATQFATMPEPAVNSLGSAVLGDWLYVYSGHVGTVHKYSKETTSKHFRRLSLADGVTWEELPIEEDLQGVPLVSDGQFLYRVGGMHAVNAEGEPAEMHSVATFARFDPDTKSWSALPPLPEGRSTHDAWIIGRTLYVAGGWVMSGPSEASDFVDTALAFDLDNPDKGWVAIEQPFELRALATAEQDGKLFVLGGLIGGGMTVDRRVDVYNPKDGTWSHGPDLPDTGNRVDGFGTSAVTIDGKLYYSGGSGMIFRLSDDESRWDAIGSWAVPRITHRLVDGPGDTLMAVGGSRRGEATPVIEIVPIPE